MRAEALEGYVAAMFERLGLPPASARLVAESLVEADLEGVASHGVALVPLYVERLQAGSVSLNLEAEVAHDAGAVVVLDAAHALGQLTATQAVRLALERARRHGLAAVAVRQAYHFGAAARWAKAIAAQGLVGMAMSNTRPLMPPPGGAERIVGNNPLAIAFPAAAGEPLVVDMAMSATAMGRIRLAHAAARPIPEGWATDAAGRPTTDPAAAIQGMLLPAAGPKGFGLAVAIDLLCGGLSGGNITDEVGPLYGDPAQRYGCSHLFLALDPAAFGIEDFGTRAQALAQKIRNAKRAEGTERLYAPGDLERSRRAAHAQAVPLAPEVLARLHQTADKLGMQRIAT